MSECVICYARRPKSSLRCVSGHPTCTACIEKGDLLVVSRSGWPIYKFQCPVCRQDTFNLTSEMTDIRLARAVIKALQKCDDSDDED